METEFYRSIPPEIREKLQEYVELYAILKNYPLNERTSLKNSFNWESSTEGFYFWENHHDNNTFPIWSEGLNRFINP